MDLSPFSASLGAMGSLPGKLDELLATRHWALRGAVMDEIEQLTADLHILLNFLVKLSNAQDPPMTARYWMKDVREFSYDMVDCADQFVHADGRAKIHRATRRKVITRLKISRLPERWKWRPWVTNKVSEFRTRAQEATQRYWRYQFDGCACNPGYSRIGHEHPTVLPDLNDLVGMEGPMNQLDRWLTSGEEKLMVVSIVGVGGIGKTTLAQNLWGKLRGQFECRAFVRTAQKPDMRGVIRSILSQVRPHQPPEPGEMHHLIRDLREYLQDKRYFIIIDDLWATSVWDVFSRAFPEGNCCSRIITTTEIMEVALVCCGYRPEHIFKLESLSDDESEKLVLQRFLVSGNQQFDDILAQIKRICGGLPLAIIIVASLFASQPEKLTQLGLTRNSSGANHTMEGFMGQILNICFNSLPHYLKTCLLYLSMYPEGCLFLKGDLVKQWVAEGFICAKEGEDMEEIAGSYFDELVSMGLIQAMDINYNYEVLSYSVHHMVLDLITYKSIEENFITVVDYSQMTIPLTDKVRRLSLHFGSSAYATTPASTRLSHVRSLFFSGLFKCVPSFMAFKLLRVLALHLWDDIGNMTFNLEGICELFQLRYLRVTCNVPVKLPDKIEPMKQLETLDISVGVCAVPEDIVRLPNLLHLRLQSGTNLPDGVGCMRSLRSLMYFDLGNSSEDNLWGLGELTNLRDLHLTYSSSLSGKHLKKNLIALATSLGKLCNLRSFTLASGNSSTAVLFDGLSSMYSTPIFLERFELLPPICIFSRFPKWIGQLHRLCILKVAVRELLMNDIDILTGLHSLKVLSLCIQTPPERRIVFHNGVFPVLKYFKFRCGVLYMSFMAGAMPNVRKLKLCFNTHIGEKYDNMLAGVEHLLNLKDTAGRIGATNESDGRASELAFKDAISKNRKCPRLNIKWVDPVDEEYHPSEKEHRRQEKGLPVEKRGVLEKSEDTSKHADDGLSQGTDLLSTVASCCLKSEKTAEASEHHFLERMLCNENTEPKCLELSLLEDITNKFSDDREIGRSESGVVYKGKLRNGSTVVVKRLAIAVDDKQFLDGVRCLMSVKHGNIARFLGYCANTHENVTKEEDRSVSVMVLERLLCFEYPCNGNLQMHLTDESCGFNWHMRYQIIKEICQGLHYLHDNCITHLDLKPGNILFDENMVPKLVDCGYSRFLGEEISRVGLANIGGSLAYMDTPEYLDGRPITYQSDIYSLGVIIMQIVTGRNKKDCSNTVGVLENWRSRLKLDISPGDTSLEICYRQVRTCIEIAMSCMDHEPGNRSTTGQIIYRFEKTDATERSYLEQVIVRSKGDESHREHQHTAQQQIINAEEAVPSPDQLLVNDLRSDIVYNQDQFTDNQSSAKDAVSDTGHPSIKCQQATNTVGSMSRADNQSADNRMANCRQPEFAIDLPTAGTQGPGNDLGTCSTRQDSINGSSSRFLLAGNHESSSDVDFELLWRLRKYLVLLGVLAVCVTYNVGLTPPGRFWTLNKDGHDAGDPVLHVGYPLRYELFFYCNATAFAASLVLVILLLSKSVTRREMWLRAIQLTMLLDLISLLVAFAAGSCRALKSSVYIWVLVFVVLVYVVSHTLVSRRSCGAFRKKLKEKPQTVVDGILSRRGVCVHDREASSHPEKDVEEARKFILMLATFTATITYQAGLHLPGATSVRSNYLHRYNFFVSCNATSFVASLATIILLLSPELSSHGIRSKAVIVCVVADLFGLIGACAAGWSKGVSLAVGVIGFIVWICFALLAGAFVCKPIADWLNKIKNLKCIDRIGRIFSLESIKTYQEMQSKIILTRLISILQS